MAQRYGNAVDLWDEVILYLLGIPYGTLISKWSLREFLDGCRGNEFSEKEFEEIVVRLQDTYGITLSEGSLGESMRSVGVGVLFQQEKLKMERENEGFFHMSKFDEFELSRCSKPPEEL